MPTALQPHRAACVFLSLDVARPGKSRPRCGRVGTVALADVPARRRWANEAGSLSCYRCGLREVAARVAACSTVLIAVSRAFSAASRRRCVASRSLLQLGAQPLLGIERRLRAAVLKFGSLAPVALLAELTLELGTLAARLLLGAIDGGLRTLVGLLDTPLRGRGELLGALGLLAGELRVLLGGVAFELSLADLLQRPPALLLGILRARERCFAVFLRLLGPGQRLLRLLAASGRRHLGGALRGRGGVGAREGILGCALGFLGPRLHVAAARFGLLLAL
jgi:hypothetical protein